MGTRRTDLDITRDEKALELNGELLGTGIRVVGGGRRGPYAVTVDRLNEKVMRRLVEHLREWLAPARAIGAEDEVQDD
jgi:hypothetical protein